MGLFSNAFGKHERLECSRCGDTYRFNISREFPYAICGYCLEKLGERAKYAGDNELYQSIQREFRRRGSNWS